MCWKKIELKPIWCRLHGLRALWFKDDSARYVLKPATRPTHWRRCRSKTRDRSWRESKKSDITRRSLLCSVNKLGFNTTQCSQLLWSTMWVTFYVQTAMNNLVVRKYGLLWDPPVNLSVDVTTGELIATVLKKAPVSLDYLLEKGSAKLIFKSLFWTTLWHRKYRDQLHWKWLPMQTFSFLIIRFKLGKTTLPTKLYYSEYIMCFQGEKKPAYWGCES